MPPPPPPLLSYRFLKFYNCYVSKDLTNHKNVVLYDGDVCIVTVMRYFFSYGIKIAIVI